MYLSKDLLRNFTNFFLQMSKLSSIINFAQAAIEDEEEKKLQNQKLKFIIFLVNQILFMKKIMPTEFYWNFYVEKIKSQSKSLFF